MKLIFLLPIVGFLFFMSFGEEPETFPVDFGEKLFREDRFAQSFFAGHQGDVNSPTSKGDPVLEILNAGADQWQHPHRGGHMSCASCHFVDQVDSVSPGTVLTYNDLTFRTPVPRRGDGQTLTPRNSMNMVMSTLDAGAPLHWDGEFFSGSDLVCATLSGRNMGWVSGESQQARQHVADVIRMDTGVYPTDSDIKESYTESFKKLGFDVSTATDNEILERVCESITTYMADLDYSRDADGQFNGSGYDQFLQINGIRRGPKSGESSDEYLIYLKDHINFKTDWKWKSATPLKYHEVDSEFGPLELQGMKLFFGRAQCVTCHTPPRFTDSLFHNTGISQSDYEKVHGVGAFQKLKTPSWTERLQRPETAFVASEDHIHWKGPYRRFPDAGQPQWIDLGAWNILGHPDMKEVQAPMKQALCRSNQLQKCSWTDEEMLEKAWGRFKTPTLRSLGQGGPYLHAGTAPDLTEVLRLYFEVSHRERRGEMRNVDPFMRAMHMMPRDFKALEAFLNSLNEDYD